MIRNIMNQEFGAPIESEITLIKFPEGFSEKWRMSLHETTVLDFI